MGRSSRGTGILGLVTLTVILVTLFVTSITPAPLIYWDAIHGSPIAWSVMGTSSFFHASDAAVQAVPLAMLFAIAILAVVRVYQRGWRLERRLLSTLLCLLVAKDLLPLLTVLLSVAVRWRPSVQLGIWDPVWIGSIALQAVCALSVVSHIGFRRDLFWIETLWAEKARPAGLLMVGFGLQRSMAAWAGIQFIVLWLGGGLSSMWLAAAFAILSVGVFGLMMAAAGVVVLRDHRINSNLLAEGVLALGLGLAVASLLYARLGLSPLSVTYVVLGTLSAILSALWFCSGFRLNSQPALG